MSRGRGTTTVTGVPARARRARPGLPVPAALALVFAFALVLVAPVSGPLPAAPARAAETDLTLVTDATYTVEPEHGRVHVSMSIVARNHRGETRTKKYYFDRAYLAVQSGTTDFRVSGAKGARVRVAKRTRDVTLLRIDFGKRLYGGSARTYKLSFNLVDKGKPANRPVRVGSSLVTFPVWAFASDGAKGSRVRVRFPAGYQVAVESGAFDQRTTTDDGGTLLATEPLANPLTFFAYVSAQREAVYRETPLSVTVGDQAVPLMLRAWNDDPAWATRVGSLFSRALPVLRDEIGLDWPVTWPMTVQEAVSRVDGGYAGLFDPSDRRIEVAYWADPLLVVHEAAHGWFNGALLSDRWAAEGFAALYAQRTAKALEVTDTSPVLTDEVRAAAIPLNAWAGTASPSGNGTGGEATGSAPATDPATDAYGYAASLALAQAIADRAGDDAMRRVWAAADAGIGAYQPSSGSGSAAGPTTSGTTVEPVSSPPDWRALLDLLESETDQPFDDLWRTWVVRPEEAPLLDARAAARASYQRTLALAGDWSLPRPIRDAMRAWQFDAAEQLMADARTVLAQRNAVGELAARDGLSLPETMRGRFESGDLAGASATAEAERNAMLAMEQAGESRSTEDDPLSRLGMLGEDPGANLAAARTALADGDIDASLAASDQAYRAWSGAWQEGRRRALLAIAAVASVLVLVSAAAGRRRRARSERASMTATPPASTPPASTPPASTPRAGSGT